MAHLDARARGAVPRPQGRELTAVAGDLGATRHVGRTRLKGHLSDAGDGGEGLAAEAERADAEKVVGILKFAGGVADEGQWQVVGVDAAAVVHKTDKVAATLFNIDVDARAAGVDGVLQQFLDDAGRPLDDLAGGDLADERRR